MVAPGEFDVWFDAETDALLEHPAFDALASRAAANAVRLSSSDTPSITPSVACD